MHCSCASRRDACAALLAAAASCSTAAACLLPQAPSLAQTPQRSCLRLTRTRPRVWQQGPQQATQAGQMRQACQGAATPGLSKPTRPAGWWCLWLRLTSCCVCTRGQSRDAVTLKTLCYLVKPPTPACLPHQKHTPGYPCSGSPLGAACCSRSYNNQGMHSPYHTKRGTLANAQQPPPPPWQLHITRLLNSDGQRCLLVFCP